MSDDVKAFPQNLEAERALLGAAMQRPSLLDDLDLEARDFYRKDHGALWALMLDMRRHGEPIDMVTLPDRVGRDPSPGRFGGVGYVTELPDHAPSTANAGHYARLIAENARRRRLIAELQSATERLYARDEATEEIASRVLDACRMVDGGEEEFEGLDAISPRVAAKIAAPVSATSLLSTGLDSLDEAIQGFGAGELIIVAARPSMGKSALALHFAEQVAREAQRPAGIVSLEMPRDEWEYRGLAGAVQIPISELRAGRLSPETSRIHGSWDDAMALVADWAKARALLPVLVSDKPRQRVERVVATLRRMDRAARKRWRRGLGLAVVDYLQLVDAHPERGENRAQAVADVARHLKDAAKELECPIVACAQIGRGVESRDDKRPRMSDLKDSGGIEEAADMVLLLYRDDYYHDDSEHRGIVEIGVAKHRQGAAGDVIVPLRWDRRVNAWSDLPSPHAMGLTLDAIRKSRQRASA